MITDLNELLLFIHKPTEDRAGINRLWLIEAAMEDRELQLLHQAANDGYIRLNRQVSSGSEYLDVELTTIGRARLNPQTPAPQLPEVRGFARLSRWLSNALALQRRRRNPAHH